MSKFDNMGKVELRAACKAEGIVYGKLNNDGMRAALNKAHSVPVANKSLLDLAVDEADQEQDIKTNIGKPTAIEKGAAQELAKTAAPKVKAAIERAAAKAAKAPRVARAASNGVTMPGAGTICAQIWAALDSKRAALKSETPTFEHLRELAKAYDWQKNTAMTQYQRWKQFYGLMPRSFGGANDAGSV